MNSYLFLLFGGILSILFIRMLGFKRFMGGELLLGLVSFIIAIGIQQVLQQVPMLDAGIKTPEDIHSRGPGFVIIFSLYFGFTASIVQTFFKYIMTKDKNYAEALNVGLGFGFTEALFLGILSLVSSLSKGIVHEISLQVGLIGMLERFSAVLFHVGSVLFLVSMVKKNHRVIGVSLIITIHGIIDSLASYFQLTKSYLVLITTEILIFVVGISLVLFLIKKAIQEQTDVSFKW